MVASVEEVEKLLAKYDWDTANLILAEAMSEMRGAKFESKLPDDPDIKTIKEHLIAEAQGRGPDAFIDAVNDPN